MNEQFYYTGIGYIIYLIISLMHVIFRKDKETEKLLDEFSKEMPRHVTEIDIEKIKTSSANVGKFSFKKLGGLIFSLFFFGYIICGAMYSEESKLFVTIILTSIMFFVVPLLGTIANALGSKEFIVTALIDSGTTLYKSKVLTVTSCIEITIKIIVVSFITYNHFYPYIN